eukprot:m.49007 g.49007  ORF g.49007 m.49007 type:complete len:903 (-) comp6075_c0_seq1:589-3297(-)
MLSGSESSSDAEAEGPWSLETARRLAENDASLVELDVSDAFIGEEAAGHIGACVAGNTRLRVLTMRNCGLTAATTHILLERLRANHTLAALDLGRNALASSTTDGASPPSDWQGLLSAWLSEGATLQRLILDDCRIPAALAQQLLSGLRGKSTLMHLSLAANPLGDGAAAALADWLTTGPPLRTLDLHRCSIGPDGAQCIFTAASHVESLSELNLGENIIGDDDAVACLSRWLASGPALRSLSLRSGAMHLSGLELLLAGLKANTTLTTLSIAGNELGDAGAVLVADHLARNPALTHLNMSHCGIGSDGAGPLLAAIRTNTALQSLKLADNAIAPDLGRAIEASLHDATRRAAGARAGQLVPAPFSRARLCVCGPERAGKTSLVRALQRHDGPPDDGAGVARVYGTTIDGKAFCVWDFAGRPEYHPAHEVLLHAPGTVFVVLCRVPVDGALSQARGQLDTWLHLIAACAGSGPQGDGHGVSHRAPTAPQQPPPAREGSAAARESHQSGSDWTVLSPDCRPIVVMAANIEAGRDHARVQAWLQRLRDEAEETYAPYIRLYDTAIAVDCSGRTALGIATLKSTLKVLHPSLVQFAKAPACCKDLVDHLPRLRQARALLPAHAFHRLATAPYASPVLRSLDALALPPDCVTAALRWLSSAGELLYRAHAAFADAVVLDVPWLMRALAAALSLPRHITSPRPDGIVTLAALGMELKEHDAARLAILLVALDIWAAGPSGTFFSPTHVEGISATESATLLTGFHLQGMDPACPLPPGLMLRLQTRLYPRLSLPTAWRRGIAGTMAIDDQAVRIWAEQSPDGAAIDVHASPASNSGASDGCIRCAVDEIAAVLEALHQRYCPAVVAARGPLQILGPGSSPSLIAVPGPDGSTTSTAELHPASTSEAAP